MGTINLSVGYNLRDISNPIHNFSVLANVSPDFFEDRNKQIVRRGEKKTINEPEWTYQHNTGISDYFKKHNGFNDQERYNRVSINFVIR